jgi:hypothetical protein
MFLLKRVERPLPSYKPNNTTRRHCLIIRETKHNDERWDHLYVLPIIQDSGSGNCEFPLREKAHALALLTLYECMYGHSNSNIMALLFSILSGLSVFARRCLWSGMGLGEFIFVILLRGLTFDKLGRMCFFCFPTAHLGTQNLCCCCNNSHLAAFTIIFSVIRSLRFPPLAPRLLPSVRSLRQKIVATSRGLQMSSIVM